MRCTEAEPYVFFFGALAFVAIAATLVWRESGQATDPLVVTGVVAVLAAFIATMIWKHRDENREH